MQQVALPDGLHQFPFQGGHDGRSFRQGFMDRARADPDVQPVVEEFLDARPRHPVALRQRHHQGRQPRANQPETADPDIALRATERLTAIKLTKHRRSGLCISSASTRSGAGRPCPGEPGILPARFRAIGSAAANCSGWFGSTIPEILSDPAAAWTTTSTAPRLPTVSGRLHRSVVGCGHSVAWRTKMFRMLGSL